MFEVSPDRLDLSPLQAPFFDSLRQILDGPLQAQDAYLFIGFSDYGRHNCLRCGANCQFLDVLLTQDFVDRWAPFWQDSPWPEYQQPFVPLKRPYEGYVASLKRQPNSARCLFLQEDNSCFIHAQVGPEAKPPMCQKYPQEMVIFEQGLGTLSVLKSCTAAPALMLQDQQIYVALIAQMPENVSLQAGDRERSREDLCLWLGLGLDFLAQKKGPVLQRLRHFAQLSLQIALELQSTPQGPPRPWRPALEKCFRALQAGQDFEAPFQANLRAPMWRAWQSFIHTEFPTLYFWLADRQELELSPSESGRLNHFLWHYLRQIWVSDLFRQPRWDRLLVLMALKSVIVQAMALYFKAQQGMLEWTQLGRALNAVERRLAHSQAVEAFYAPASHGDEVEENIKRVEGLLQLDFSLWAVKHGD